MPAMEDSLANNSQALKPGFFEEKEAYGNARPPRGRKKRDEAIFC
jgi:hypothetical protein